MERGKTHVATVFLYFCILSLLSSLLSLSLSLSLIIIIIFFFFFFFPPPYKKHWSTLVAFTRSSKSTCRSLTCSVSQRAPPQAGSHAQAPCAHTPLSEQSASVLQPSWCALAAAAPASAARKISRRRSNMWARVGNENTRKRGKVREKKKERKRRKKEVQEER